MKETRILLLDFDLSGEIARALCEMLSSSSDAELRLRRETLKNCESVAKLVKTHEPDLILLVLDQNFPERPSVLFRSLKQSVSTQPLMVITEASEPDELFTLLRLGAADFMTLPLRASDLLARIWRLLDQSQRRGTAEHKIKEQIGLQQLVGESPVLREAVEKLPLIAQCDSSVMISGETGTGKEICARLIHYLGPRMHRPFIPVNCGAVPTELVENELFGHERGAFTDATSVQHGLVREADGGTLFLDEIDALPLPAQVKLLRFLQDKEYRPLGSARSRSADVRIIAAASVAFETIIRTGLFRQDLYYRLNVIPLRLPPLRERREDIPLLASHFLNKYTAAFKKPGIAFSDDAKGMLSAYEWPGNVRELEHLVERVVVLSRQPVIQCGDLSLPIKNGDAPTASLREAKAKFVDQFERTYIRDLLLTYHGNVSKAARVAKKDRRAFWHLIRKYGIDVQTFRMGQVPD